MNYKGQAELIIIVALMIVIGVVVVSQMGLIITPSETPDVRNARESVEGLMSAAVLDTLETMSDHGGYISAEYSLGSVTLNDDEVPYWQRGGQVSYPDMVLNMQAGVQSYLDDNKESFEQNLPGIVLGQPLVGTPVISRDRITLSVTMPVTYKETQFPQPFTVSVESSLGEIYEFSKGFAVYEKNNRPIEYYTLSSMMLSPLENGHHKIPVYEVLFGCGDHIFASSWDVMPEVENEIMKTLNNIYMPGKAPEVI
ncbi:MAG: hypothetical protein KAT35_03995, partial [Candidatus Aenigmarchaeota archaeon]|nr:hypothetical protein [Candidatus Aenigmarchaeota archaeon]